jgi:hypothetical protein
VCVCARMHICIYIARTHAHTHTHTHTQVQVGPVMDPLSEVGPTNTAIAHSLQDTVSRGGGARGGRGGGGGGVHGQFTAHGVYCQLPINPSPSELRTGKKETNLKGVVVLAPTNHILPPTSLAPTNLKGINGLAPVKTSSLRRGKFYISQDAGGFHNEAQSLNCGEDIIGEDGSCGHGNTNGNTVLPRSGMQGIQRPSAAARTGSLSILVLEEDIAKKREQLAREAIEAKKMRLQGEAELRASNLRDRLGRLGFLDASTLTNLNRRFEPGPFRSELL